MKSHNLSGMLKSPLLLLCILIIGNMTISCSEESLTPNKKEEPGEKVYRGFVNIESQTELDAFASEKYDRIDGGFMLIGNSIANMEGLNTIKEIEGDIYILGTSLVNIDGLRNTNILEDSFIEVINNPLLEDLNGFEGITSSIVSIEMRGNPNIKDISGLRNISAITYFLQISETDYLADLDALSGIQNAIEYVIITENSALEDIGGLGNIPRIKNFSFSVNNAITSFTSLPSLMEVEYLVIAGNESLQNIDGLAQLHTALDLTVQGNSSLKNLNGFMNLENVHEGNVRITDNTSLQDFCGLGLLASVQTNGFNIARNYYNPTKEEIQNGNCAVQE